MYKCFNCSSMFLGLTVYNEHFNACKEKYSTMRLAKGIDAALEYKDNDNGASGTPYHVITGGLKTVATLPTDSGERKNYPLLRGCIRYFPAALAGVAKISKQGNDKHNPGEEMHHARGKSPDHGDCIVRHLVDVQDLLATLDRDHRADNQQKILDEASQMAWRALAFSQELHERFGAPMAPGAKK